MSKPEKNIEKAALSLPPELVDSNRAFPVFFVDTKGVDLSSPIVTKQINKILFDVLCQTHHSEICGQTLIKVHIGEPKCVTRMRPEYITGSVHFLKYRGASSVVGGDTTVAYSGPRGHKQNPKDNSDKYLKLAQHNGWSINGSAGIPFVVLDRPCTAFPDKYEFTEDQICIKVDGVQRFNDFFPAGGFLAADFIINHAHLTMHDLAGVAGCVKSIAMGCSGLTGKLRMHQSLFPFFDQLLCKNCGLCIDNCPEKALFSSIDGQKISVNSEVCIGCGECVAVCKNKAVRLKGKEISDWTLGEKTLPMRMADYTIGIMNGRWHRIVHILHMYSITKLCDCVDVKQKPFVNDLGFLVGKNPFTIDKVAAAILSQELEQKKIHFDSDKFIIANAIANYVERNYGIISDVPFHPLVLSNTTIKESKNRLKSVQ